MDKLTKRLLEHSDEMMETYRNSWNKVDLPMICVGIVIFCFGLAGASGRLFIGLIIGLVSAGIFYYIGYQRKGKSGVERMEEKMKNDNNK